MRKIALAGAQDIAQNVPNQLVDFLRNMLRRLTLKSYLVLYRTRETEGSRPAMKSRRNERVDLSCK